MSIKTGKVGKIFAIDSTTVFTTEAMTEDGSTMIYQIDDTAMRYWDINTDVVISAGVLDKSYFDNGVNYFEGKVKLTTTGESITTTGSYLDLAEVTMAFGWSLNMTIETGECTVLGADWSTFHSLGKSASVNISRCRDDVLFDNPGADTSLFLLQLFEDATYGYICNGIRTGFTQDKAVGSADKESTTFQVTSQLARF